MKFVAVVLYANVMIVVVSINDGTLEPADVIKMMIVHFLTFSKNGMIMQRSSTKQHVRRQVPVLQPLNY